jgi:hypothetical protein
MAPIPAGVTRTLTPTSPCPKCLSHLQPTCRLTPNQVQNSLIGLRARSASFPKRIRSPIFALIFHAMTALPTSFVANTLPTDVVDLTDNNAPARFYRAFSGP